MSTKALYFPCFDAPSKAVSEMSPGNNFSSPKKKEPFCPVVILEGFRKSEHMRGEKHDSHDGK